MLKLPYQDTAMCNNIVCGGHWKNQGTLLGKDKFGIDTSCVKWDDKQAEWSFLTGFALIGHAVKTTLKAPY